jgi:hypothetical protein
MSHKPTPGHRSPGGTDLHAPFGQPAALSGSPAIVTAAATMRRYATRLRRASSTRIDGIEDAECREPDRAFAQAGVCSGSSGSPSSFRATQERHRRRQGAFAATNPGGAGRWAATGRCRTPNGVTLGRLLLSRRSRHADAFGDASASGEPSATGTSATTAPISRAPQRVAATERHPPDRESVRSNRSSSRTNAAACQSSS